MLQELFHQFYTLLEKAQLISEKKLTETKRRYSELVDNIYEEFLEHQVTLKEKLDDQESWMV